MIYAIYNKDGYRPDVVVKTKTAVKEYDSDDVRSYANLTEKQVKLLTYTQATFMEMLLNEAEGKIANG